MNESLNTTGPLSSRPVAEVFPPPVTPKPSLPAVAWKRALLLPFHSVVDTRVILGREAIKPIEVVLQSCQACVGAMHRFV